jgi:hypothetical protein
MFRYLQSYANGNNSSSVYSMSMSRGDEEQGITGKRSTRGNEDTTAELKYESMYEQQMNPFAMVSIRYLQCDIE